jgi:lipooligosaccharide transport system permease protein
MGPRVAPRVRRGRGSLHVFERNLLVYKNSWVVLLSGVFEPLFYLFAVRVGIGGLVGGLQGPNGEAISYAAFVAPALLASSAMNGAMFESTMNIFFKLRYAKLYDAMLATPLSTMDIALGEIGWALARGALYAAAFLVVMAAQGLIHSPLAVLALPSATLIGFAFGAAGMAATTYMKSWQDFDLVNLAILVLFLFSATFYPLDVYPESLQAVAQVSPLYHGVTLIRGLTLGTPGAALLWHALFLAAMGAGGLAVAGVRLKRILSP